MKLSEFTFDYPEELVAQAPLSERDQSRLLVCNGASTKDSTFSQIADELRGVFSVSEDTPILLIVNDSKVFPARVRIRRESGARGEVFVLSTLQEKDIPCLLRPLKKLKVGEILLSESTSQPVFRVTSLEPPRVDNISPRPLSELLDNSGEMPLPPYIVRDPSKMLDPSLSALDKLRYQTVYARAIGSAAAPTAGLHFTPSVLENCASKNIVMAGVTLHVGLGTFQPVTATDVNAHEMHSELCSIPASTMRQIIKHSECGWPIVFVGTTALRTVESVLLTALGVPIADACSARRQRLAQLLKSGELRHEVLLKAADCWISTDLFIRPKDGEFVYQPVCGEGIITNFHQPESTLVMLIASLLGYGRWRQLYSHAIASRYRLFSYGDSSLLVFSGVQ
ncbi:MAG: hypothetical protein RLZZ488_2165 [Pseudomonadota bacterium]|jgi:S-adenosylmethionine:tRNA ribosyltransferase-isomerase